MKPPELAPEIIKQVEFAKSHSNVKDAKGACIFRGKRIWVIGFNRLPTDHHYTDESMEQHPEIHITAVMDVIMKMGSYKHSVYTDFDIAVSDPISISDLALVVDVGFRSLWVLNQKLDPAEYFRATLKNSGIKL